jgi:glycosyltransferase involved in cell wall biosynthesis
VVAREVSNVHLVVVGEDRPDETGRSFRARLESLAGELQVREQLHCLGKIPNPLPLVRAADICVLCSETEGLSNAVIEYMLAGKPVICTDVGGNRELVVNEETGFLISLGDVAGMARRMVQLLMGPELARAMGERGGERARRLFSREAMIAHHEALYLQLLQRPSAEGVGVV